MTIRLGWENAFVALAGSTLGLLLGLVIGRGSWAIPVALAAVAVVVLGGFWGGFVSLSLVVVAALIQLPLVRVGSVAGLQLAEAFVPLLLLGGLLRSAVRSDARHQATTSSAARVLNAAVAVYAGVVASNFLRSKYILQTNVPINRPFYAFFVALGTYLLVYRGLTKQHIGFQPLFRFLWWLSLVMSALGIIAVLLKLPLNLGSQQFSVIGYRETSAVRVGFLDIFGTVGLALVAIGVGRFRLLTGLLFAGAMIASGGRSATAGMIIALGLYLLFARRWMPMFATVAVALVVIPFALPTLEKQSEFQRLTNISARALSTSERGFYYREAIRQFARQPLLGTGMGVSATVSAVEPTVAQFEGQQLAYGGHATYHSLLKNFGLLGFVPFVAALGFALLTLARRVQRDQAAGFFFIVLAAQAISLYTGGNGSDPFYFFCLGGAAAVVAGAGRRAPNGSESLAKEQGLDVEATPVATGSPSSHAG